MSDNQLTSFADGVRVTKRLEREEFSQLVIVFKIESQRNEPVTVRLIDEIPDDSAPEDIGFHLEYDIESWMIRERNPVFEREIQPNEEYETLYQVRDVADDAIEDYLSEPTIETSPAVEDTDATHGQGNRKTEAPDGHVPTESMEEGGHENPTPDRDEPVSVASSDGGTMITEDTSGPPESTDEDDSDTPTENESTEETLVAAIATELEEGDPAKDDIQRLRTELCRTGGQSGPLVARVEKLQRDVDEVLAYTSALENFLDEEGTGEQLITEFRDEMTEFRTEMSDFRTELEEMQTTVNQTETRLDQLEADVEMEIDDVETELATLEEEIGDLREWQKRVASAMGEP